MKKLINAYKIYKLITTYPDLFGIVASIFNTLCEVGKNKDPRLQKISIDFKTIEIPRVDINLWICAGEGSPMDRIRELKNEIEILKQNK